MLHTIQATDVIPIWPPAVGWVAAATVVVMFPKDSWHVVCVSCLVALKCGYLIGAKMSILTLHIDKLTHVFIA